MITINSHNRNYTSQYQCHGKLLYNIKEIHWRLFDEPRQGLFATNVFGHPKFKSYLKLLCFNELHIYSFVLPSHDSSFPYVYICNLFTLFKYLMSPYFLSWQFMFCLWAGPAIDHIQLQTSGYQIKACSIIFSILIS